ncbi:MAG TPA: chloride channel protein [Methylocella sp.]|jgi:CIC family chloride channel protein
MGLCALAVGVIAGFGAVVFRAMIGGFHNLLFLGLWSFDYEANVHTPPSPWGTWIILVPALGAIGVAFLVTTFAPEAKGHGVPEVMDAIYRKDGRIRPIVAVIKSLASALSIGSGGSVGREGPIIQVGAAFGSTIGQLVAMPARQRALLIAAGAGAGIAATFNTPIGGIVFAVELMLPFVTSLSLLWVGLSCVTATYIGRMFFGAVPSFNVPSLLLIVPSLPLTEGSDLALPVLPWFALLGIILGVLAWLLTRGIYWFEDLFDALPGNYYTRHISGMLLVGLIMYGFMAFSERYFGQPSHYYVQGVGYATIMDILRGELTAPGFLLLLVVAKLLVTCLTLGSGASGGVFSPSMFLGAALGGCFGSALLHVLPDLPMTPAHFAYAGMAGMVGGTTGAVLTGTIMIFEMTRDYTVILPVILTVVLACAVRNWLSPSTIYTLKLLRRGEIVPQGLQARLGEVKSRHLMTGDFLLLPQGQASNPDIVREALLREHVVVVTGLDDRILGVFDERSRLDYPCGQFPPPGCCHVVVDPEAPLNAVLRAIDQAGARVALVTRISPAEIPKVLGVITERDIARLAYATARLTD